MMVLRAIANAMQMILQVIVADDAQVRKQNHVAMMMALHVGP